jgi:hypothetical protein
MKKELIVICICMLFITTTLFSVANANIIKTTIENERDVTTLGDRPKIEIFLPDVHVYVSASLVVWGVVDFDEPGAIIDVDLSDIEADEVSIKFSYKIIYHTEFRIFPATIISSIIRPDVWASSSYEGIGLFDNRVDTVSHGYCVFNKVEDETYPLNIVVTGVPILYRRAVFVYYNLILNVFPELFDIPTALEEAYGGIAEYQLHVHS